MFQKDTNQPDEDEVFPGYGADDDHPNDEEVDLSTENKADPTEFQGGQVELVWQEPVRTLDKRSKALARLESDLRKKVSSEFSSLSDDERTALDSYAQFLSGWILLSEGMLRNFNDQRRLPRVDQQKQVLLNSLNNWLANSLTYRDIGVSLMEKGVGITLGELTVEKFKANLAKVQGELVAIADFMKAQFLPYNENT